MAKNKSTKAALPQQKVRVLYQNLGGIWYAFADAGTDVYIGRVPTEHRAPQATSKVKTKAKNRAPAATKRGNKNAL
jgi:hypothetical protein